MAEHYHIVGGGPVGFAAALLLAKEGARSTVYESRAEVVNIPEESYPIGVNARGLHTMELISPEVAQACRDTGMIINSWQIFGGKSMVAEQKSGVVYGTSRAKVNQILADAALNGPLKTHITIANNHRLRDVNMTARELVFEVRQADGTKKMVTVSCASNGRVIAADGVGSKVRRAMEAQERGFKSTSTPWKNEFRVIFASPGATAPSVDEKVHYIFNGFYAATLDNGGQQQWSCVMGARDGAPAAERRLLISDDPSNQNVAALRGLLKERAPRMEPLFSDDELRRYFGRRTFRGSVVECNYMSSRMPQGKHANGEWLLLLGDAAHSVLPPTGEGINSGLEDAMVLAESVRASPSAPFAHYEKVRMPDLKALVAYAKYLNDGFDLKVPGEGGARLAFTIFETLLAKCGVVPLTETLFGSTSAKREAYGKMVRRWQLRAMVLLPIARCLIYPFAWLGAAIQLPMVAVRALKQCGARDQYEALEKERQKKMKPPIAEEEEVSAEPTPTTADAVQDAI